MDIDMNNKLEITISNSKPVNLVDLTQSLLSFSVQYQRFIDAEAGEESGISGELLIKDVRHGLIVIELVSHVAPFVPLLWEGGSLTQWVKVVQDTCTWLLDRSKTPPRELSKKDLKDWSAFLSPVAKDQASQININVSHGAKIINQVTITSDQASIASRHIQDELLARGEIIEHVWEKCAMHWYQAKFDQQSDTGNKAIIEAIYPKPLKVVFANKVDKAGMMQSGVKFNCPWHDLVYIVDVAVHRVNNVPKVYKITGFYPEDTFDPEA